MAIDDSVPAGMNVDATIAAFTHALQAQVARLGGLIAVAEGAFLADLDQVRQDLLQVAVETRVASGRALALVQDLHGVGREEGSGSILDQLLRITQGTAAVGRLRARLDALEARYGAPAGYDPAHQP
jgi:hypothetical protein